MGAQAFIHSIEGRNAKECFEELVREADKYYGIAPYNGSINTCDKGRCRRSFVKYSKKNEEKMKDEIHKVYGYGEKWVADYIDLGVTKYVATTVKKETKKHTAKYVWKFIVLKNNISTGFTYTSKSEADKKAMELALIDTASDYSVKKGPLRTGNDIVSEFVVEKKEYKTKPSLKPLPNRKVEEIHKFIFFGWASC